MGSEQEPRYRIRLTGDESDRPTVIIVNTIEDEIIAHLAARVERFGTAGSPDIDVGKRACEDIFGGHHWTRPLTTTPGELRVCGLCEARQTKDVRWEDVE